jgi:hypothetical protein
VPVEGGGLIADAAVTAKEAASDQRAAELERTKALEDKLASYRAALA